MCNDEQMTSWILSQAFLTFQSSLITAMSGGFPQMLSWNNFISTRGCCMTYDTFAKVSSLLYGIEWVEWRGMYTPLTSLSWAVLVIPWTFISILWGSLTSPPAIILPRTPVLVSSLFLKHIKHFPGSGTLCFLVCILEYSSGTAEFTPSFHLSLLKYHLSLETVSNDCVFKKKNPLLPPPPWTSFPFIAFTTTWCGTQTDGWPVLFPAMSSAFKTLCGPWCTRK